jgi:hypothetical protein
VRIAALSLMGVVAVVAIVLAPPQRAGLGASRPLRTPEMVAQAAPTPTPSATASIGIKTTPPPPPGVSPTPTEGG